MSGAAALLAGAVLLRLRPPPSSAAARWAWPGDADSAATMAQTVAASVITVTSLTFTLTVIALQLASQQFSPRLLREFARDLVTRVVLAVLVATFVLAVTVLRGLRADQPVPSLAVLAVFVLGLVSLGALLGFITHLVRVLRVDTMMLTVHDEADQAIAVFYPAYEDGRPQQVDDLPVVVTDGAMVHAERSGFVRLIDVAGLVEGAREEDAVVRVEARPGDHVMRGAPVATVWSRHGGPPQHLDAVQRLVRNCVVVGYERTMEQDAAYGFRQLEDIAVKALSPGDQRPGERGARHRPSRRPARAHRQLPSGADPARGPGRRRPSGGAGQGLRLLPRPVLRAGPPVRQRGAHGARGAAEDAARRRRVRSR